jgi:predicted transposase YbfD/YdcC
MEEIRAKFGIIEDTRHPSYIEYRLVDVLIIVMLAVLCGFDELGDIILYAQNKQTLLKERFSIEKIPSKPTLSRILSMVDGAKIGEIIIDIMREKCGLQGEVIAVDGKAIRSTSKPDRPHSALQILTAYVAESGVVLGQQAIHEKTNEIPVFQDMLEVLDVKRKTITADAMHCQRETCRKIITGGGDYVFGLKSNQQNLCADVMLFLDDPINNELIETHKTIEKNAGRIEERICRKVTDISWLESRSEWPGLQTIFSIRRVVDTRGKRSDETCYYISSLDARSEKLMKLAREHWKIEALHWLLDVTFSEDACRFLTENAHKTLNSFRKFALFLHKQFLASTEKKSSLKAHMTSCLLNDDLLVQLVANL